MSSQALYPPKEDLFRVTFSPPACSFLELQFTWAQMLFSVTAKEKVLGERRGIGNFDRQWGIVAWVRGRKLGF